MTFFGQMFEKVIAKLIPKMCLPRS